MWYLLFPRNGENGFPIFRLLIIVISSNVTSKKWGLIATFQDRPASNGGALQKNRALEQKIVLLLRIHNIILILYKNTNKTDIVA